MITPYTIENCVPAPLPSLENALWIDVECPDAAELAKLHERFGIPLEFLRAPEDINERPRLEHENGITLLLARTSQGESSRRRLPFATRPLAIIVTPSIVFTVCHKEGLARSLAPIKSRICSARPHIRFALAVMMRISDAFMSALREMDARTEAIELTLHKSMRNSELVRLLHLEKSLIYFSMALKANHGVLEKFTQSNAMALSREEAAFLDDALIEAKQAVEMADIFSQTLLSLGATFGAIVSNNLNKAMKFLAAITIVLMIPSILAGLYGMNVPLPFAERPYAFALVCAVIFVLCGIVWYWFRRKDWL